MPPIDDAKLAETMAKYYPDLVCKYYPDQPSYTPPPSSKPSTPPTIEESLAKLGDSIDKLELVTKRLVAKRLAASTTNLVSITSQTTFTKNESNDHTSNNKTDITETTTAVVVSSMAKIQNVVPAQIRVPFPSLILDKLAAKGVLLALSIFIKLCFCWLTTIPPDDQSPPKSVFLESEHEPPWEPYDPRYKTFNSATHPRSFIFDGNMNLVVLPKTKSLFFNRAIDLLSIMATSALRTRPILRMGVLIRFLSRLWDQVRRNHTHYLHVIHMYAEKNLTTIS
ncbi:hypothetical protein Tco_0641085 [Tanacetum coccineum]